MALEQPYNFTLECHKCSRRYQEDTDYLRNTWGWRVGDDGQLWFHCSCSNLLAIPSGNFNWYSPELVMSPDAQDLFRTLVTPKNLPHIPATTMQLIQILNDETCTVERIAKEMKSSPLLIIETLEMAQKLKQARNPDDPPISVLEHAIVYIGIRDLGDILIIASLKALPVKTKKFDLQFFWKKSIMCGLFTEALYKEFGDKFEIDRVGEHYDGTFAYIAGCLSSVGFMVAGMVRPDEMDQLAEMMSQPDAKPVNQLEVKNFSWSSMVLGEIACVLWGLPEFVTEACRYPKLIVDTKKPLGLRELVNLANNLTHWACLEPNLIDQGLFNYLIERIGIDESAINNLVEKYTHRFNID